MTTPFKIFLPRQFLMILPHPIGTYSVSTTFSSVNSKVNSKDRHLIVTEDSDCFERLKLYQVSDHHTNTNEQIPQGFAWVFDPDIRNTELWNKFRECFDILEQQPKVQCKYCKQYMSHPLNIGKVGKGESTKKSNTGTISSLIHHLNGCQNYRASKNQTKNHTVEQLFGAATHKSKVSCLSQHDVLTKVLNLFISSNIAFNQVDNHYFEELVSLLKINDELIKVNCDNITKRLHIYVSNAKEDLMACLMSNDSKISISMDCWTSDNNIVFLGSVPLYHTFCIVHILIVLKCALQRACRQ